MKTFRNYFYSLGKNQMYRFFSIREARKAMRELIKEDLVTPFLNRDERGRFYIDRYSENNKVKRFYL